MLSLDGRGCSGCVSSTRIRPTRWKSSSATPKRKSGSSKTSSMSRESSLARWRFRWSLSTSGEVLGATIDGVRPATQAKGVRLDAHLDPDVAAVSADPHRLQQVFWNVLSNAVKFTRADDLITVSFAERKRLGRDSGCRYRCRDSTRRAAVRVRSLPSGRFVDDARSWRTGSRSRHRSAHRRAPRRNRGGGQPGGGPGRDVHDSATARSRYSRFDAD